METRYNPQLVEKDKYQFWLNNNYFVAGQDKSKPAFSMVIPPPNVTGILHLGHAWDNTIQDIIARYKRAQGYDVLWVPGMDHAGIATQAKVDARLQSEGTNRFAIGREKFLEAAWKWKAEYADTIRQQWAKMGLALDYSRERFTLDEGLNRAVKKVFVTLYKEGLIYRGEKIINWDPKFKTALSNIEVIYRDDPGKFYYFKYNLVANSDFLVVATTRPETMFGDVCLVVNPKDKRFSKYINQKAINPANGAILPIIADEYVDISFGTGVMKCTPAHDPNDFIIGEKYHFPHPIVMHPDGTMNELAGPYNGMDRFVCREQLVAKIQSDGNLVKIEDIIHPVGHSERSDAVIEPYLSKQWFVKMRPLAEASLANQKTEQAVKFIPDRFARTFAQWMENAEDWCISRQLWWGHQIPAYYNKVTGEVLVSEEEPNNIDEYIQDEDVLDTWFSSALWPFSTLGWPDDTDDYKRYFPLDVMSNGYDIIFFWVSRMIFQSLHFTAKIPFKVSVLHGLIRDAEGRKMSKSLGNGINPMDVINKYGADALRYFLATGSTPGQDTRFIEEKVQSSGNYLNKIWNAARYILLNISEDFVPQSIDINSLNPLDLWLYAKLNATIKNVTEYMDKYEFGIASTHLYNFVYDDFCSWYLEMSKVTLQDENMSNATTLNLLYHSIKSILMMIYPFTPFIAEEIYQSLPGHKHSIMEEEYPQSIVVNNAEKYIHDVDIIIKMISDIRSFKKENNLAPNAHINVFFRHPEFDLSPYYPYLKRFGFIDEITISNQNHPELRSYFYGSAVMTIDAVIDQTSIISKLKEEINFYQSEIARSEGMLNNSNFVKKAPVAKVENERQKVDSNRKLLAQAEAKLKLINK